LLGSPAFKRDRFLGMLDVAAFKQQLKTERELKM
jgi:hypothetical protein